RLKPRLRKLHLRKSTFPSGPVQKHRENPLLRARLHPPVCHRKTWRNPPRPHLPRRMPLSVFVAAASSIACSKHCRIWPCRSAEKRRSAISHSPYTNLRKARHAKSRNRLSGCLKTLLLLRCSHQEAARKCLSSVRSSFAENRSSFPGRLTALPLRMMKC